MGRRCAERYSGSKGQTLAAKAAPICTAVVIAVITPAIAAICVTAAVSAAQEKKVTIEQIQKRVSEHFGMRAQDLKIRSNSKVIAFPRQFVSSAQPASSLSRGRVMPFAHRTSGTPETLILYWRTERRRK
jgi:hypothetical protein